MSQENIAIVRRFEDSWARRDLDSALECIDTDFEFDWSESMGLSSAPTGVTTG